MPNLTPFGDWRIRLGIILGVLVFCATMIVLGKTPEQAWWSINTVTVAMLGAAVVSDFRGK